jgi:cation diffusion facilitator CzcD-associated flavoprotein CzcO
MIPTEPFTNGSPTESSGERFDVVVIGAGQAGLGWATSLPARADAS